MLKIEDYPDAYHLFDSASDPKYMLKTTGSHLDAVDGHKAALSAFMGHAVTLRFFMYPLLI